MSMHDLDDLEFTDLVIDPSPEKDDEDSEGDDGYYPMLISSE